MPENDLSTLGGAALLDRFEGCAHYLAQDDLEPGPRVRAREKSAEQEAVRAELLRRLNPEADHGE